MKDENNPAENERRTAPDVSEAELLAPEADPDADSLKSARSEVELPEDDGGDVPEDLDEPEPEFKAVVMPPRRGLKRLWDWFKNHKKLTIPLLILVLLGVAVAVPQSRYPLLGQVLQRDYTVQVLDKTTHLPVTNAEVALDGQKHETDNHGTVHFRVHVGQRDLKIGKKYYQTNQTGVLVAAWGKLATEKVYLQATGRQVPVSVTNKITGQPVENALVRAADTEARTDKSGKAVLVLPTGQPKLTANLAADGYNNLKGEITVTAKTVPENSYALTPAGNLYFLSNLSGKIDVVKTNLDGSGRQTVLAGTGNESDNDTGLWQTADWKYLVLKAKREPGPAKLFLIDTSNDKVTAIDEGDANFSPVGWSGHHFVYVVNHPDVPNWKPLAQALKTYDADSGKVTVIGQTAGEGTNQFDYGYTNFSQVFLLGDELVYATNWYGSGYAPNHIAGKKLAVMSAQADGGGRHTIKDFPVPDDSAYSYTADFSQYKANGLFMRLYGNDEPSYFVYENGKLMPKASISAEKFVARSYAPHYVSADGSRTFWIESRDGKSAVFVGDKNGLNEKQAALLSDMSAYGWYGNDYLLLYNDESELYILPASGGNPTKVTDFRLPDRF